MPKIKSVDRHAVRLPMFGKLLMFARRKAKLTIKEVSEKLLENGIDVNDSFFCAYKSGRVFNPTEKILRVYADIFDLDYCKMVEILAREKYHVYLVPKGDGRKNGGDGHRTPFFGRFIRRSRRRLGLSVKDISREFSRLRNPLSAGSISSYELGKLVNPSRRFIRTFSRVLGIEYQVLAAILIREKFHVRMVPDKKEISRKNKTTFSEEIRVALEEQRI